MIDYQGRKESGARTPGRRWPREKGEGEWDRLVADAQAAEQPRDRHLPVVTVDSLSARNSDGRRCKTEGLVVV
jgi:hypothetical protein